MLLLAAASSMSACIIPVAPNFQDPPTRPDAPPGLSNFGPAGFGSTFSITSGSATFSAIATDPDPGTTLYVRWVVDYPPYTATTYPVPVAEFPAPAENDPPLQISQKIDCGTILDRSTSTHYLELIVADAPLADPDPTKSAALEQLTRQGSIAYGRWTINITCPQFMPPSTP